VGITGSSGVIYGVRFLEELKRAGVESHLIISKWGKITIAYETKYTASQVEKLASFKYSDDDLAASVSSGSFQTDGMVVIPCSMKTLGGVVNSYAESLIVRAADVTLKESRKLVLVPREAPLNRIHLKQFLEASEAGAIIMPAMPGFYHKPTTMDDLIDHVVGKTLDLFEIKHNLYERWDRRLKNSVASKN
jgi:flavin prenyltransferase